MQVELGISVHNILDEEFEYKILEFDVELQRMLDDSITDEVDEEDMFKFSNIFRYGMTKQGRALAGDGIPVPATEPTDKTAEIIVRSVNSMVEGIRESEN